jgi:hypothetical protein
MRRVVIERQSAVRAPGDGGDREAPPKAEGTTAPGGIVGERKLRPKARSPRRGGDGD